MIYADFNPLIILSDDKKKILSVIDKSFIEVVIPNSITSIETLAFSECRLESVYIPNSVSCIEEGAFYGCSFLNSIYIANGLSRIGEGAFHCCTSLKHINIPNSVAYIGMGAFWDCSSLESVTIPNNIIYIGNMAFKGCNSLRNIYIPCKDIDKIKVHNAFEDINFNECVLHIPYGTRVLYRSHPVFRQFKNIVSEIFE